MNRSRLRSNANRDEPLGSSLDKIRDTQSPHRGASPYAPPTAPYGAGSPPKRANYALYLWLFLGGNITLIIGAVLAALGDDMNEAALLIIGGIMAVLGGIANLVGAILSMIYLHRAWSIIPQGYARTTPGKAIGFLFIPFFNIYWLFQAFPGWASDYNRWKASQDGQAWTPVSKGVFITLAVLAVIPYINFLGWMIMGPIAFAQMCRAINRAAAEA